MPLVQKNREGRKEAKLQVRIPVALRSSWPFAFAAANFSVKEKDEASLARLLRVRMLNDFAFIPFDVG